jgi:AraC-like DNA-binding protein
MSGRLNHEPVTVSFFLPSEELRPYISSIYLTDIAIAPGQRITDWLMPEWAAVRMGVAGTCHAAVGPEPLREAPRMMVSGPTSFATRIEIGPAQIWGIGILPLGWARLIGGPAEDFADSFADGQSTPELAMLTPLYDLVFAGDPQPVAVASRINAFLLALLAARSPVANEERIRSAHRLLLDDSLGTVTDLNERLEMSPRSFERFSQRTFGFPAKLLLRRQRFTRSLAQFLLDPSLAWIKTIDPLYVDQAHFVRDFKRFMGMSPSAYGQADKPILRATAHARAAALGGAIQALHRP